MDGKNAPLGVHNNNCRTPDDFYITLNYDKYVKTVLEIKGSAGIEDTHPGHTPDRFIKIHMYTIMFTIGYYICKKSITFVIMENIEKRLEYFIANQGYNYSQFADLIGVQRSSISHIITGRNKPSYDFLRKMFNAFPELNADWLVMGRGRMFHEADDQVMVDKKGTVSDETREAPSEPAESDRQEKAPPRPEKPAPVAEKPVSKVILFYDNGRFEEFLRRV